MRLERWFYFRQMGKQWRFQCRKVIRSNLHSKNIAYYSLLILKMLSPILLFSWLCCLCGVNSSNDYPVTSKHQWPLSAQQPKGPEQIRWPEDSEQLSARPLSCVVMEGPEWLYQLLNLNAVLGVIHRKITSWRHPSKTPASLTFAIISLTLIMEEKTQAPPEPLPKPGYPTMKSVSSDNLPWICPQRPLGL